MMSAITLMIGEDWHQKRPNKSKNSSCTSKMILILIAFFVFKVYSVDPSTCNRKDIFWVLLLVLIGLLEQKMIVTFVSRRFLTVAGVRYYVLQFKFEIEDLVNKLRSTNHN